MMHTHLGGVEAVMATQLLPLELAGDPRLAGGKASALSRMLRDGLPVPRGLVVPCDALQRFLNATGLEALPGTLLADADPDDITTLAAACRSIRAEVLARPLPRDLETALLSAAAPLLEQGPVAVRSSAVGEDGADASFAGQFDSVLHVTSADALCDAVRQCWASYWSARAMSYRHRRGVPAAGMAVIVQQQVRAAAAGVLFTRDPQGPVDRMVVEWVSGLADRLVSGEATPRRLYLSRTTGTAAADTASEGDAPPLTSQQVAQLVSLATRLEVMFGCPQDIEWTLDSAGRISIVQSRPITGLSPGVPATSSDAQAGSATGGAARSVLWSNANISENFPDPVSPLLYSIACAGYGHYFRNLGLAFGVSRRRLAAMDPHFRTIVGAHGARLYYNLTAIHAVLRMAPFGERLASAFNLFVGADRMAAQPAAAATWRDVTPARQALELLRIAASVAWQYAWLPLRLRRFERTADSFARATTQEALSDASAPALGSHLMAFVRIRCDRWKDASLCDTAAMVMYAALRRALARRGYGDSTHTKLLRALPNVPSSVPAVRLWALSRQVRHDADLTMLVRSAPPDVVLARVRTEPRFSTFRDALDGYLREWGFRSSGELMLTVPTLEESPQQVLTLLRSYVDADDNGPVAAMACQAAERQVETRAILAAVGRRAPWRALYLWGLLRLTQGAIACRERARLKQALLYTRLRRVALAIGDVFVRDGRLRHRDDVFMLTWRELEEICAGRAMFPDGIESLVQLRRSQHAYASTLTPPDTFTLPEGQGWTPRTLHPRSPHPAPSHSAPRTPHPRTFEAPIACGGRVTAPAAVLSGIDEVHLLTRGDVLVTRQTDPGWAPVFPLVSGLVIERGGMLSHGAIIAREFGLPCLVGVRDATTRIPHGAVVTIDAETNTGSSVGIVRLEPDGVSAADATGLRPSEQR